MKDKDDDYEDSPSKVSHGHTDCSHKQFIRESDGIATSSRNDVDVSGSHSILEQYFLKGYF